MSDAFIHNIKSDERGLVAAIVQDAETSEIIALSYLDGDTLAATLQSGQTDVLAARIPELGKHCRLTDVRANLDGHSLTVLVERHLDESSQKKSRSLLNTTASPEREKRSDVALVDADSLDFGVAINDLYSLIERRKNERPEGSYTTYLFNSGLDKILKKIAEESGEVIIAAKNKVPREIVSELADLFYHLLVLMVERDVKLGDVRAELVQRSIQRSKTE
jgi:phosphoribosyl-ATP pyrophosphohydrolase/phosphoribosyl-AMP cyclohydrolase